MDPRLCSSRKKQGRMAESMCEMRAADAGFVVHVVDGTETRERDGAWIWFGSVMGSELRSGLSER